MVGVLVVLEGDRRAWRGGVDDLVGDAVAGVRAEVHVQPAVEPDGVDHRRRVRGHRPTIDALVPDVAGGEDRTARAHQGPSEPCRGLRSVCGAAVGVGVGVGVAVAVGVAMGVATGVGARCRRRGRGRGDRARRAWIAGRVERVGAGGHLDAIAIAVAVRVGLARMRPVILLLAVRQPVVIRVLLAVTEAIPIGVLAQRAGVGAELGPVPERVAVGVLVVVALPVAVRVGLARMGADDVLLPVGQAIVIGILLAVGMPSRSSPCGAGWSATCCARTGRRGGRRRCRSPPRR